MFLDSGPAEIGAAKSKSPTSWRWVRWLFVYPALALAGCHLLMTGSPIPLWYSEQLDHPVDVKALTDNTLVLADGRSVALPFIKRLPKSDPVFLKALTHGVEVNQEGEVAGLIRDYHTWGNVPFLGTDRRINLSDLAGLLNPDGIDDSIVPAELIKDLRKNESRSLDSHSLPFSLVSKARSMRSVYETCVSRVSVHLVDNGSPYENTRPGVKYVGNTICARCHGEISETYRRHPMGRSLAPIASAPARRNDNVSGRVLFESHGLEYSIENRDGHIIHRESKRDVSDNLISQNEGEVQFALGSGRQGVAYLIERDGFLFQSPISWYVRERKWDLPPGYETFNPHFDRPIESNCLFCHANQVESVAGPLNRYRPPIFQGHAIGCERCHGPGELHVKRPTMVDGRDTTIVNPAGLELSLRDAVCQQCHLIGDHRVERLDRRSEDYRPGLPFYWFWTVLQPSAAPDKHRAVGQVEQMHESRCYRASRGRLGCISCHDPHLLPAPEEKVAYYRERCLGCHAERDCRLPSAVRLGQSHDDDCAGCHMPRSRSSDIIHAASTSHLILRHADEPDRSSVPAGESLGEQRFLVNFHRELMDERERAAAERDIGVALSRDGPQGAAVAAPKLEAALAARPDDVAAWEAKGFALGQLGRGEEALAAFRTALTRQPGRESALTGAGYLASRGGRRQDAITFWQRAVTISPWRSDYHAHLASLYFQAHDWHAAAEACRETLRLNPANLETRKLLVGCTLRLKGLQAARSEFQTLLKFDPPDREELIRRFAPLSGTR